MMQSMTKILKPGTFTKSMGYIAIVRSNTELNSFKIFIICSLYAYTICSFYSTGKDSLLFYTIKITACIQRKYGGMT